MNDQAKIPLVIDPVEPLQRLHSKFEGDDKPRTEVSRDTLGVSRPMRRWMRG